MGNPRPTRSEGQGRKGVPTGKEPALGGGVTAPEPRTHPTPPLDAVDHQDCATNRIALPAQSAR